ncbi:MAG: metallophosphoesterase [Bacteroidia bacterium]|nr:metallophosphoesterase [Bacteroidia bacterium]
MSLGSFSRRGFLRSTIAAGAGLAMSGLIPSELWADTSLIRLTILHTNDVHSRIDSFPATDPKFPNMGGVAPRAELIKRIRNEVPHVLLFDSGDMFQGTPYFNFYKGELEIKLMSQMGYDAGTIGNHDFDAGIDGLEKQLVHATFPLVSSNYDFSGTVMEGKTLPYSIFNKGGIKVGVFGLGIELDGLVGKNMYGDTKYQEPIQKANEMAGKLKNELGCHLVVCLSHLGFSYDNSKVSDKVLAKNTRNVDIILGGHTHTFLEKPWVEKDLDGKEVMICQVGWGGIKLGRIDCLFKADGRLLDKNYTEKNIFKKQ